MLEKRSFGNTGHMSSVTLFGAAALGGVSQDDADRTLDVLLEYGVNHIDVAASYGHAEERIGPWMKQHRKDFFLATKTGERTYQEAKDEIHQSLERLQTDQIDLIQLHGLIMPNEWDVAMGPGGALEAAVEARDQGLVRFIGVTGHNWSIADMHMRSIDHFQFDSVLLPYNFVMMQKEQYAQDFEKLVATCHERNIAVQTIKSIARGPWATSIRERSTWYQPLEMQEDIDRAVHWVVSRPHIFLNTVGDIDLLPKVLDAATRVQSCPSDEEMSEMLEGQKMTSIFGI